MSVAETSFSILSASSNALEYPPSAVLDGKNDTMWMTTGLYPQEIIISVPQKQLVSRITVEAMGAATIEVLSSEKTLPTHFIPLTQLSYGADTWQAAAQSFPAVSARFIKLVVTQGHNAFAAIKHRTRGFSYFSPHRMILHDEGIPVEIGMGSWRTIVLWSESVGLWWDPLPPPRTSLGEASITHSVVPSRMQAKPIAQASFDTFYFEMIKYIQNQYDPEAYIATGMSPDAAASYCVTNVCTKLEAIGQRVGQRYITHAARNHQWLLQDSLSRIKLLCRDAWMGLFGKHVDKLQTNHKGMFVIAESNLPLVRLLRSDSPTANIEYRTYAAFALGLVRGAITALGLIADVVMEINAQKEPFALQFMITEKESST